LQEKQKKKWKKEGERIKERYSRSLNSEKVSMNPDTPSGRDLKKKLAEMDEQFYRSLNVSSSSSNTSKSSRVTKFFSTCLGKQ
jgi:hypothetical protein